ncbi:MAG: PD-(D/E)XK nuclease family protein [Proteobacteria bacterium]|nr:PD-(D/E)XK nuclease family protein [Pseudomonadota bacterium]
MESLINSINEGVPVLTVNVRLSRKIGNIYDMAMQDEGHTMWQTPHILPLSSWVTKLWEESWPEKALISNVRATALWEQIILNDKTLSEKTVLIPRGVVKSAFDAYRLIHEYLVELPEEDIYLTEECRALKGWIKRYEAKSEELGFIDRAHLPDNLIKSIQKGQIKLPHEIMMAGFDEITPQVKTLLEAMAGKGVRITFWPARPTEMSEPVKQGMVRGKLTLRQYDDEVEEVVQAARWIRETYSPGMKIGVIAPDLNRYKKIIQREFSAELDPPFVFPWIDSSRLFNISLGISLLDEPVIGSVLQILSVDGGKQDMHTISDIILSPYFLKSHDEHCQLARLDAEVRKANRLTISLDEMRVMAKSAKYDLPDFVARLETWTESLRKNNASKTPSLWVEAFNKLLNKIGWPARDIALSSAEYQALSSWNETLASFSGLDDITGKISRADALSRLTKIAREKLYQPETADCPIEVIGMLEASGMHFDHIWLLGAHEEALPGAPAPNPFIPIHLQKKHNLPRSFCERELHFSKTLLNRLLLSAQDFEVSFPKQLNDKEVKLSPLFSGLEQGMASCEKIKGSRYKDCIHEAGKLENIATDNPIPVTGDELDSIAGGTLILKNYSDCPFRAFAVHRLHAQALATPEPGITAMERGSIVHKAMEHFWAEVEDLKKLHQLIEKNSLDELIRHAAESGIKEAKPDRPITKRFMALEIERLEALIKEWINVEKERTPFMTKGTETAREIMLDGLNFRGRIDRIDQLEDDKRLIIDYKTGVSDPNDWLSDRPKDPQLMLYSMTGDYDGVAFARLKRDDCRFYGIARDEDVLPGIKPFGKDGFSKKVADVNSWEELMEKWHETVKRLAEHFMRGITDVDPRDYGTEKSACRYCEQAVLCRIFERDE